MQCEFRGGKTSADACLQHAGMNMVAKIQLPLAKQKCSTSRRTHLYKKQTKCIACWRPDTAVRTVRKVQANVRAWLAKDKSSTAKRLGTKKKQKPVHCSVSNWVVFFHFLLLDRRSNSSSAAVNDRTVLCLNQYLVLLLVNGLNWISCSFKLAYQKQ